MRASLALLLRGMRWRLGISLLTVLTSTIAVGAAVLGPLYLRTAGDSVMRTTVAAAAVEDRGATISVTPGQATSIAQVQNAAQLVEAAGGVHRFYGAPITSVLSGVNLVGPRSGLVHSQLFSRTGICRVVRFEAGGCDLGFGDVAISDRSARELGVSLGHVLDASVQGTSQPLPLKITGIYAAPDFGLSYWWGNAVGYFPFGQTGGGALRLPAIDSLIASSATALGVPPQDGPEIVGQVPLLASHVSLGQESRLRTTLSKVTAAVAARGGVTVSSQLPALLADADHQRHVMSTIVAVASVQLVLLAIWVLGGVLVRSSDARQAEIRVARLRGFPPSSLLAVTALEPATLCAVGLVLGIAAAWGAVAVARSQLLTPSAAISPDIWVFAALTAALAAIVGSLAFGTVRLLRRSGLSDTPGVARTRPVRATVVADTVVLVLSVVALIALATNGSLSGHSNPIASAAPGLIALGMAVIAVQLVLLVCRIGVSASAFSGRVALFLALRQIVRRPALMRQTRVLIIALGLACFAISAWSVARTNRATAASFSVGTTNVVTVTPRGIGLERAVEQLDPQRRFAMAAIAVTTPSSTLLAVDASRLTATMTWPHGISSSSLSATARLIDPPTAPAIELPDAPVQLAATTSAPAADLGSLEVALWLSNPQTGTAVVGLGPLRSGAATYQSALTDACPGGCRLAGIGVIPAPGHSAPSSGTVQLSVTRLSVRGAAGWARLAANLLASGWRSSAAGVHLGGRGLTLVVPASATAAYTSAEGFAIPPMAAPADHPAVLPAAVTSEVESINGGATTGGVVPSQGLDGNTLNVGSAVTATALPHVGQDAVIVDLGLLQRAQVDQTTPYASDEVWLGPHAPANAIARLRALGLRVDGVQSASAVFGQLEHSAPALADDFLLVATIVALLAAAASTLGTLGANIRQRATELTALEVGGTSRRVLARSLAFESAALVVTALFGTCAGLLAAVMAIPALPELSSPSLIPLQYGLPGGWVAAVTVTVIAVILISTAVVAAVLVRRMSPLLLRIAANDSNG